MHVKSVNGRAAFGDDARGGWQLVYVRSLRRLKPVNGLAQPAFNQLLPFR